MVLSWPRSPAWAGVQDASLSRTSKVLHKPSLGCGDLSVLKDLQGCPGLLRMPGFRRLWEPPHQPLPLAEGGNEPRKGMSLVRGLTERSKGPVTLSKLKQRTEAAPVPKAFLQWPKATTLNQRQLLVASAPASLVWPSSLSTKYPNVCPCLWPTYTPLPPNHWVRA